MDLPYCHIDRTGFRRLAALRCRGERRAETGEKEKSDSQQAFLVAAVEERPHLVAYGQSRVPMNLLS